MEIAAFLVLSVAILVAGNLVTGVWGLVLITVMIVGTLIAGATVKWQPWTGASSPSPEETNEITNEIANEITNKIKNEIMNMIIRIRRGAVWALFIFELVAFGLLLGYGSQAASDANPQWGCVGNDSFAAHNKP